MTQRSSLATPPVPSATLGKRIAQGAGFALLLIVLFLLKAGEPKPEWGKLWMLRPLLIVPLAGGAGGAFYYFMHNLRHQGGWKTGVAYLLSLVVYSIGLWLGIVLGLDGTYWN